MLGDIIVQGKERMGEMNRGYLELVGLLVTNSTKVDTYHIDYVYKWKVGGNLEGTVIQKGFDFNLHIPFTEIVRHLSAAYAPALQKRWTLRDSRVVQVFMSLHPGFEPIDAGKWGRWELDCEL